MLSKAAAAKQAGPLAGPGGQIGNTNAAKKTKGVESVETENEGNIVTFVSGENDAKKTKGVESVETKNGVSTTNFKSSDSDARVPG